MHDSLTVGHLAAGLIVVANAMQSPVDRRAGVRCRRVGIESSAVQIHQEMSATYLAACRGGWYQMHDSSRFREIRLSRDVAAL